MGWCLYLYKWNGIIWVNHNISPTWIFGKTSYTFLLVWGWRWMTFIYIYVFAYNIDHWQSFHSHGMSRAFSYPRHHTVDIHRRDWCWSKHGNLTKRDQSTHPTQLQFFCLFKLTDKQTEILYIYLYKWYLCTWLGGTMYINCSPERNNIQVVSNLFLEVT